MLKNISSFCNYNIFKMKKKTIKMIILIDYIGLQASLGVISVRVGGMTHPLELRIEFSLKKIRTEKLLKILIFYYYTIYG